MKKFLCFAALAAVFAGCTNENEDYETGNAPQKIVFESPVMNKNSRAAITGTKYPEAETFKVFAHRHKGSYAPAWSNDFMNGVTVSMKTEQSTKKFWAPEQDYYWPKNGDMITFAAYSPASLVTGTGCKTLEYSATGLSVTDYELSSTLLSQVDLMYAPRVKDKTAVDHPLSGSADASGYYGVDINFKHALSLINFTVKSDNQNVKLKEITISNARDKGTFNEAITDAADYSAVPEWTKQGFQKGSESTFTVYKNEEGQLLTDESVVVPSAGVANLLMIPQTLESTSYPQKLTIKWTYQNGGITTEVKDEKIVNLESLTIKSWGIGMKYTYNIIINLDKIYFNPTVTDWVDGGSANIEP